MKCTNCKFPYDKESHIPLLLIKCGHTLCSSCCRSLFIKHAIICPDCKQITITESVSKLPKNISLIIMTKTNSQPVPCCESHHKKLEGFCENDKRLLCIDCILVDGHKNHKIKPVIEAAEAFKEKMSIGEEEVIENEKKIKQLFKNIAKFKDQIKLLAENKLREIKSIYGDIIEEILKRENELKQKVTKLLADQQEFIEKHVQDLTVKLRAVETFKTVVSISRSENDYKLLGKVISREELLENASIDRKSVV